jgi:hypothetical protein
VARRPFDELDPVPVRVAEHADGGAVLAGRALDPAVGDALRVQVDERRREVVDLEREVAEPVADVDPSDRGLVDQLEGHDVAVAGEVEHHPGRAVPLRHPTDLPEAEVAVKGQRPPQVRDAVTGEERLHRRPGARRDAMVDAAGNVGIAEDLLRG